MEEQYDITIIGAGPGGYQAAIRAAQYGAKVALIEKDKLGGTCLNRGCIPTKALYESAYLIEQIKEKAEEFGIEIKDFNVNFAKAIERKNKVVKELVEGIIALQKAWKNRVYEGHGKIIGGNIDTGFKISIQGKDNEVITTKTVIIATGSSPTLIPNFNIDHERILTSNDILDPSFNKIPKRLLIIGAGVIGCEFAYIFNHFGSKVIMLEYLNKPIATEEPIIIRELENKFKKLGIEIHTSLNVLSIENTGSGVKAITCDASVPKEEINNAEKSTHMADLCLVSIGREKESKNIGLEKLDIKTNRGSIKIDPFSLETSVRGIYAIGDVTGGLLLAHVASYEGDIAVSNALSRIGGFPVKEMRADYSLIPATIFISPNIGSIGIRRKSAKNQGIDVIMGLFSYQSHGKAKCMGEDSGFLQILCNKVTNKIIGASCMGVGASGLIAEIALAMQNDLTIQNINSTIHSHPTLSEIVREASQDVLGKAIHKKGRPINN